MHDMITRMNFKGPNTVNAMVNVAAIAAKKMHDATRRVESNIFYQGRIKIV
jgi:hypothetical protein